MVRGKAWRDYKQSHPEAIAMKDDAGARADLPGHSSALDPLWYVPADTIAKHKADLMPPAERAAIIEQFGKAIEPWLDARLEAKARELVARYQDQMLATWEKIFGDGDIPRDELLCSREIAAKMLGVSLSTIKRMEEAGELPDPIKIGERAVRHRIVDIEKLAKFRGKERVPGPNE